MIKLKDILSEGLYMGPAKNAKVDVVHVRHKTSEKELVIDKSALKRYNKLGFLAYNPKDKYKGGSLKWDVPMGMQEGNLNELKPIIKKFIKLEGKSYINYNSKEKEASKLLSGVEKEGAVTL